MLEGFNVSKENLSANFHGELLIITITLLSFLGLYYFAKKLHELILQNIPNLLPLD